LCLILYHPPSRRLKRGGKGEEKKKEGEKRRQSKNIVAFLSVSLNRPRSSKNREEKRRRERGKKKGKGKRHLARLPPFFPSAPKEKKRGKKRTLEVHHVAAGWSANPAYRNSAHNAHAKGGGKKKKKKKEEGPGQ